MSDLGKMIQTARVNKGLTAKQLAKQCGVAETNIVDIEAGKKIANEALLKRFAKILEVPLNTNFADMADCEKQEQQSVSNPIIKPTVRKKPVVHEEPLEQWEMAFGNVLRKLPVYDLHPWRITDHRLQPVLNNKIDGFAPDKVVFARLTGGALQGLGVKQGDLLKVVLGREFVHNSVQLVRIDGVVHVRRVRKLEGEKILLIDFDGESKTDVRTIKETEFVGRCLSAEIML